MRAKDPVSMLLDEALTHVQRIGSCNIKRTKGPSRPFRTLYPISAWSCACCDIDRLPPPPQ
ncbi:hypothetical protein F4W67_14280 [Pseudomonas caricapapayae]|nr:hypothetical protein F4W67_14280 [Pseudomonas caricapapayae]